MFSSTIGYLIASYVLIILIIPYLIGHYRAKHRIEKLETDLKDLIDEIIKGLSSLTLEKSINALDVSEISLKERIDMLNSEKFMDLANRVSITDDEQHLVQRLALHEVCFQIYPYKGKYFFRGNFQFYFSVFSFQSHRNIFLRHTAFH